MEHDELRRAYQEVRPDADSRAAMLEALLTANEQQQQVRKRKIIRWWPVPALGAAALLLVLLSSPAQPPLSESESPPQRAVAAAPSPRPERPPLLASSPPSVTVTPPETLMWDGRSYLLLPEEIPAREELGAELAASEDGILFCLPKEDNRLVLQRQNSLYLYQLIP